MVHLSLCETHGLFVLYVGYFSTCLYFRWQKWGGAILAFYKFKYSASPSESIVLYFWVIICKEAGSVSS